MGEKDATDEVCGCKKSLPHWNKKWRTTLASLTGDRYLWSVEDKRTEAILYNEGANGIAPARDVRSKPKHHHSAIDKLSLAAVSGERRGKVTSLVKPNTAVESSSDTPKPEANSQDAHALLPSNHIFSSTFAVAALLIVTNS